MPRPAHAIRFEAPLLALALCFAAAEYADAGREETSWDHLPDIAAISFSAAHVGFATDTARHFVLDRKVETFREVSGEEFGALFQGAVGPNAARSLDPHAHPEPKSLSTSSDHVVRVLDAHCGEGETLNELTIDGARVKSHVPGCTSISAAEIVGGHLWLGTREDACYGEYPSKGIVVQRLAGGELVGKLGRKSGLTGDLVRVIRKDTHTDSIWVATELGIDEVSKELDVRRSFYLYEDYAADTGVLFVGVSRSPRRTTQLASYLDQLRVNDPGAVKAAIQDVAPAVQDAFAEAQRGGTFSPMNRYAFALEEAFAPAELNTLVPFVLAAAKSKNPDVRRAGLYRLCDFRDERIVAYMRERRPGFVSDPARSPSFDDDGLVEQCLEKYAHLGLLGARTP